MLAPASVARVPWWRRLLYGVFGPPHVFVSCARCGNLLGRPESTFGTTQPWRRGERRRIECFGTANIARPGEPPFVVCIKLDHIRFYA